MYCINCAGKHWVHSALNKYHLARYSNQLDNILLEAMVLTQNHTPILELKRLLF